MSALSEYRNSQPPQFRLDGTPVVLPPLSDSFRKSQYLLGFAIDTLFLHRPVNQVLFVTLTSAKPLRSVKTGHIELNKFFNKLRKHGREYLYVLEPQESGRIHYHLLIPIEFDAHDSTDLDAWKDKDIFPDVYRENSMNPRLKAESDWWKATASRYGFGRIEVAPIYSNAEAIRKYMTKQDWRTGHWPFVEKKSVRFWSCSTGLRAGNVNFAWNSPGGQACRARLKDWANQQGCSTLGELPVMLGKNWGYQFHQYIGYIRAFDRLGISSVSSPEGSIEKTTPGGRFSGRTGVGEANETLAGRAPVPPGGTGSADAGGACDDSRGRPEPTAKDGRVPNMPASTSRSGPLCPC